MANREITRNVFRQIISNGLDPNGVFTDYESHLLEMGLTVFNQDIYDRILERVSERFIFDAGTLPDTTPSIISERGFINKNLFINPSLETIVNVTMYGGGKQITLKPTKGDFIRRELRDDILKADDQHALSPNRFNTVHEVIYQPPLEQGSQLKVKPVGFQTSFDAADNFNPTLSKSFHCVKEWEFDKDPALRDLLNSISGDFRNKPQTKLLERIYKDKDNGGWGNFPNVRDKFDDYINKPFTALVFEVLGNGTVNQIHKIGGIYLTGNSSQSPGRDGDAYRNAGGFGFQNL